MRIILICLVALAVSGCASLDSLGGSVTTAQQQYLATLQAQAEAEREQTHKLVDVLGRFADSGDPLVQAMAIASIERIATTRAPAPRTAGAAAPVPDGPIASVIKSLAPYVLPIAQIWQADRAGQRSVETAALNIGLMGRMADLAARDPLVVTTPAPEIIQAPAPVIVDREVPVIVEPVVLEPTVIGAQ